LNAIDSTTWQPIWRHAIEGFNVLDAAFAPDAVIASDAVDQGPRNGTRGNIFVFDLDGREEWRFTLDADMLGWVVGWDDDSGEWVAVGHDVNERAPDALLRWTRQGSLVSSRQLSRNAAVRLLSGGHRLVTPTDTIDTRTGAATKLPTS